MYNTYVHIYEYIPELTLYYKKAVSSKKTTFFSRFYRAPELLLNYPNYTTAIGQLHTVFKSIHSSIH